MVCLYNNNKYQSQSVRTAHFVRLVSLQIGKKAYFFPNAKKLFFELNMLKIKKKIFIKFIIKMLLNLRANIVLHCIYLQQTNKKVLEMGLALGWL